MTNSSEYTANLKVFAYPIGPGKGLIFYKSEVRSITDQGTSHIYSDNSRTMATGASMLTPPVLAVTDLRTVSLYPTLLILNQLLPHCNIRARCSEPEEAEV